MALKISVSHVHLIAGPTTVSLTAPLPPLPILLYPTLAGDRVARPVSKPCIGVWSRSSCFTAAAAGLAMSSAVRRGMPSYSLQVYQPVSLLRVDLSPGATLAALCWYAEQGKHGAVETQNGQGQTYPGRYIPRRRMLDLLATSLTHGYKTIAALPAYDYQVPVTQPESVASWVQSSSCCSNTGNRAVAPEPAQQQYQSALPYLLRATCLQLPQLQPDACSTTQLIMPPRVLLELSCICRSPPECPAHVLP